MASLAEPDRPAITRVDRYTVEVDGVRVRATEDQERRLRALAPDDLRRFLRVMGAA